MIKNPVPWPGGARCAVAYTFDMTRQQPAPGPHDSADTRVMALSLLRYGPEIAIPRIVEVYKRFAMRQTFFLPAWCMERYPAAVEEVLRDGHEVAHHGYLHEHPNEMNRDADREWLRRGLRGNRAHDRPAAPGLPGAELSLRAPHPRFAGRGGLRLRRLADGRRHSYLLDNGRGTVVELPSHYALDDWPIS